LGDLPELSAAGRLHEDDVAGAEDGGQVGGGGAVVADHRDVRYACRARREGELLGECVADRHDEINAVLGCHAADLAVSFHGFVAQLQHLSEYGDPSAACGLGRVAVCLGHQDSPLFRGAKVIVRLA
jgi:hypothetical protein